MFIIISFTIIIIESEGTSNPNLYVSSDYVKKNLVNTLKFDFEYPMRESTGCNSFAPKDWDKKSFYRYIDVMNPSLDISYLRNEIPLTIENTKFKTSDFVEGKKTVTLEQNNKVKLKLLLFENTGPQNIQEIFLFPKINNNFTLNQNSTYITLIKNIPAPTGSVYNQAMQYDIFEDPYRSFTYPNKLGTFTVFVNDPEDLFSDVSAKAKRVNNKMEVIFEIIFAQTMETSNLLITATDSSGNTMICNVFDAWEVKDFNGLEKTSLEISNHEIPEWVKNNFRWESEGKISQNELNSAIKYLENLE